MIKFGNNTNSFVFTDAIFDPFMLLRICIHSVAYPIDTPTAEADKFLFAMIFSVRLELRIMTYRGTKATTSGISTAHLLDYIKNGCSTQSHDSNRGLSHSICNEYSR